MKSERVERARETEGVAVFDDEEEELMDKIEVTELMSKDNEVDFSTTMSKF